MKVILVYPGITGVGFNSYGIGMESSWISHGLASLSACAKAKGFEVELIDLRRLKGWNHFREQIKKSAPDVVGITMMSVDYNPAMKAADIIRGVSSRITIVLGGPHPTLMTEEVERNEKINYIILGEGEISFIQLLENLKNCKNSEGIICGERPNLDSLPFVDRELFGPYEYPMVSFLPVPFMTLIAGRGCIYNCNFCQPAERIIFGKKVRRRSVDNVIDELELLREKYHFQSLLIHDDCLLEDRSWVNEFCIKYKTKGFIQPFVCQSRADLICKNEELIKKMSDCGLKMFLIGFESGNPRILRFLRKGTTVEQNYEAARICRKYGIKIWANYMLGIPTETKEEAMDTVNMIKKIKPDHYSPAYYTPHPGSDLYDFCLKNNLSLIKKHESYRRNPDEAKIKGVDYSFLAWALDESMGLSLWGKLFKRIVKKMKKLLILLRMYQFVQRKRQAMLKFIGRVLHISRAYRQNFGRFLKTWIGK